MPASRPQKSAAAAADSAGSSDKGKEAPVARRLTLDDGQQGNSSSSSDTANEHRPATALSVGAAPSSSTSNVSSARKERKRIVPTALPARASDAAAPAAAAKQPAPAAASTADDDGSGEKQQHARTAAQGTFRTKSASAPGLLSEAERLEHLETERVADVLAELERLCITYTPCADWFAGIQIGKAVRKVTKAGGLSVAEPRQGSTGCTVHCSFCHILAAFVTLQSFTRAACSSPSH